MTADLRYGRWEDCLADVECDALIVDAPYSERTHGGQRHGRRQAPGWGPANAWCTTRGIAYAHWTAEDVAGFVSHWAPRTRGWFVALTDHALCPAWESALREAGRYVFAPLACVQIGMNCRLAGDGPSSWTVWAVVSRPSSLHKWGTLPGAYVGNPFDPGEHMFARTRRSGVIGGKPLWLMRALVRDYSRPGDLVCDPCAGGGTTLLAALTEGRRAIGCEMDLAHYRLARARLARGYTPPLFTESRAPMEQTELEIA